MHPERGKESKTAQILSGEQRVHRVAEKVVRSVIGHRLAPRMTGGFLCGRCRRGGETGRIAEIIEPDLVGPDGLLAELTKPVLETTLEEGLTEHLGYEAGYRDGKRGSNERNGTQSKTVITEIGPVQIDVPRDRREGARPRETAALSAAREH